nr:uncharacterized protein LOC115850817 [Globicephala melas]XP_030710707.1 uncharacterized protein LOC115852240 [Globicephala melas]
MAFLRQLLLLCCLWGAMQTMEDTFWGISRTWPVPMPVHAKSRVLPILYASDCSMYTPCIDPQNMDWISYNGSSVRINKTLCFSWDLNVSCIGLLWKRLVAWDNPLKHNQMPFNMLSEALSKISLGAQSGSGDGANGLELMNVTTLLFYHDGVIPVRNKKVNQTRGNNTLNFLSCVPNVRYPPVFTSCAGKDFASLQVAHGFRLSFNIKSFAGRKNCNASNVTWYYEGWPFYSWVVTNDAGASMDLSALAMIYSSNGTLYNVSGEVKLANKSQIYKLKLRNILNSLYNYSKPAAVICVQPPFMFLLSNDTEGCNKGVSCWISQCWNGTIVQTAVVLRIPTFVPIPVKADPATFPLVNLVRQRRDLGITAALIIALTASVTAAATAAAAMVNQVQSAAVINGIVKQTSLALENQNRFNTHLHAGILSLNQRMDLLEDAFEELYDMLQLGCVAKFNHLCVTPYKIIGRLNQSKLIGEYLKGNWSEEAERLLFEQRLQIIHLNTTELHPISFGNFASWLSSTFLFFKEWVGMGAFGILCAVGIALCLWLVCRLKRKSHTQKIMLMQALVAIENGQPAGAWISLLNKS